MKARYDEAFGPANQTIDLGEIPFPSGRVVACDPFMVGVATPFKIAIVPGIYHVQIAVVELPRWGRRVGMARVVLKSNVEPTVFEPAHFDGSDSNRYFVEGGLGAFMDELARERLARAMAEFYQANPTGNYYDDVLSAEFRTSSADKTDPRDEGSWNVHSVPGSTFYVAMFASGMGDSAYETYWALSDGSERVALVTDFRIID